MKNFQKMLRLFLTVNNISQLICMEVGRHDGGEYCYRISGCESGAMYPSLLQVQSLCEVDDNRSGNSSCFADDAMQEFISFQGDMDFVKLKNCFPILQTFIKDYPVVYFDSAATAQVPQEVIDEIIKYYKTYKSNVGRGLYEFAEHATFMFEKARAKVARFISSNIQEIVFTAGTTAGINLVAHIWANFNIGEGDEILVSEVEHNANFIPWQQLALKKGAILKRVPLNDQGMLEAETVKKYLCEKTKLVAITQQSNILGVMNDVASIVKVAHEVGAKVLVDAAQSIVHSKIDVKALDCDFLVFSGHKLYGPTGVGVLFIKQDIFDQCQLCNFGGGMVYSVTPEHVEFKSMPHCLEPGTQPIAQVIGLAAAIDFIEKYINFEQAQQHETELVLQLIQELQQIPGITIISSIPAQGQYSSIVTFTSDQCHAYDIAEYLNEYGIAVRAGYHCVQPYHDKLGGNASVRVSFSIYNTQDEVEFLIKCLKKFFKV